MFISLKEKVSPTHAAVIVVDVQNDFCHSDGACAKAGQEMTHIQKMVPNLARFLSWARQAGAYIVFIQNLNNDWTESEAIIEQRRKWARRWQGQGRIRVCLPETWGADFYQARPEEGDCIVVKHRYSAFVNTDLDLILRSTGIKTVIMTGVATNVCVESTARHAFMLNYYVVFVDDCTATRNLAKHRATLQNIQEHFGVVVKARDLAAAWGLPL